MSNTMSVDVSNILKQSRIVGNQLFLPTVQLSRDLYVAVNKHLENCGGKWDRKSKSHLFAKGIEKIQQGISEGKTTNEKQEFQAFFTPPELAKRVVEIADVMPGDVVLEPSAGIGNIAVECAAVGCKDVHCKELNPDYVKELRSKNKNNTFAIECIDFLSIPTGEVFYDKVVMNPPFDRNTWVKHIEHAYKFLKPGGKLVSICPNNPSNKQLVKFLDTGNKLYCIHNVEGTAFKSEGTSIRVMILEINK